MAKSWVGTSGWSYDHWIREFYPEDVKKKGWLEFYTEKFDTVELNASFYRLPNEKTFQNWRKRTPNGFLFSVKMSRYVTHMKKLLDPKETLPRFFSRVEHLSEKLGPVLIQLPPSLEFDEKRAMGFLEELTGSYSTHSYTLECRNKSWFTKEAYSLLEEYKVALCISDTPIFPYSEEITADFVYIRLHGHEKLYASNYSEQELQEWTEKIRGWNKKEVDVYIYFDNDANAYAPKNALKLRELLKR